MHREVEERSVGGVPGFPLVHRPCIESPLQTVKAANSANAATAVRDSDWTSLGKVTTTRATSATSASAPGIQRVGA